MASTTDSEKVISALRLGWYVAEVRGRNRLDAPLSDVVELPSSRDFPLPLRNERNELDLRTESQAVLAALTADFGVETDSVGANYSATIDAMGTTLREAPEAERQIRWRDLAAKIFELDSHIQDVLASESDIEANAYLVGRGLSESYWALNPQAQDGASGWSFLLGTSRCNELSRGVGRLSSYFNAYTAPAIGGSLSAWNEVAIDSQWRTGDQAPNKLYLQTRRWYELLILGQDPTTLIKPYAILKSRRAVLQALSTFFVQLSVLVVSLALIVGLAFLATYGKSSAWLNTLIGLASAAGVTIAAVQTKLKNTAQSVLTRLRQDVYSDLVAGDITDLPLKPGSREDDMRKITIEATQKRMLTAATAS